jgi:hypothetical protein
VNRPALDFITPEELAERAGWSARKVRETARGLGACRIMGNRMILTPADVDAILEASRPCPSNSTVEAKSGTIGVRLPGGDFEELQELLTGSPRSVSRPNSTHGSASR